MEHLDGVHNYAIHGCSWIHGKGSIIILLLQEAVNKCLTQMEMQKSWCLVLPHINAISK